MESWNAVKRFALTEILLVASLWPLLLIAFVIVLSFPMSELTQWYHYLAYGIVFWAFGCWLADVHSWLGRWVPQYNRIRYTGDPIRWPTWAAKHDSEVEP